MKIIEVPDYVELCDRDLKQLIAEAVRRKTGRRVQSVEVYPAGRSKDQAHCKVFLSKQPMEADDEA